MTGLFLLLAAPLLAAEPAAEKPAAARGVASIDMTACFVAGASEKNALKALRFMSTASGHGSAFRAEKFFQTKSEYSPKTGGCEISIRVAASEDGVSAEAFSSRSGKLLFIERQEARTQESGAGLYQAVAARLRKDPELLNKADGADAPKPEEKAPSKPPEEEKPLPELPSINAKPSIEPTPAPTPKQ